MAAMMAIKPMKAKKAMKKCMKGMKSMKGMKTSAKLTKEAYRKAALEFMHEFALGLNR